MCVCVIKDTGDAGCILESGSVYITPSSLLCPMVTCCSLNMHATNSIPNDLSHVQKSFLTILC